MNWDYKGYTLPTATFMSRACCNMFCSAVRFSVLQCVTLYYDVLQCIAYAEMSVHNLIV